MLISTLTLLLEIVSKGIQCRSEISEQRRRKMNARDTRIRVFFDASKIAYRIRVCAFVIHNHNFAFPVLFAKQKNKLRDCRQVENLHTVCCFDYCQFRSANAADESIHRALFRSLLNRAWNIKFFPLRLRYLQRLQICFHLRSFETKGLVVGTLLLLLLN